MRSFSLGLRTAAVPSRVRAALLFLLCLFVPVIAGFSQQQDRSPGADYTHEVYPFLGVDYGGDIFLGSSVPFGMVKLGPDMEDFDGRPSGTGYMSGGLILGFSHLHLSGGGGKYGNILVAPVTGALNPADIWSGRTNEQASVGYYSALLTRYLTKVELTSTRRVGFHRYTLLTAKEAHITVDIDHCLDKGTGAESQRFLGGTVKVLSNREVEGVGRYAGGWNEGGEYRVYFYMVTDTAASGEHTWTGSTLSSALQASANSDKPLGASLDFNARAGEVVQLKVGISFISMDQARDNVAQEIPDWNFAAVRNSSVRAWNRILSKIQIWGASPSQRTKFYTAIYHSMLLPSDRNGENPKWQSGEPYYDDYYAIWDTFRSLGPLLTLIEEDRQRDIVRSLIDIYRHEGYMPDARSGNDTGRTQGGSNADIVIADAFVKGLRGIDYPTAFQAMLKDADVPPADPRKEGRGGLEEYNSKGYISVDTERAGSRTLEYSDDDFAIAEVACGLNHPQEAKLFASRAENWTHLWDSTLTYEGVKGFIRPRNPDGSWAAPNTLIRGTWPDFFYEGDVWTYSLYAPQDVRKLIELSGGKEAFIRRMDIFFYHEHFDMTNEPGFLIPMLYDWAGRPDKTAEAVTTFLEKDFLDNRAGIPGNDDSGAMSSWFIFQSLGFYPNAGQDVYLLGTPSFPRAQMHLSSGKTFTIVAKNLDPINRYIQSATLNGTPLNTAWFRHSQIEAGGTLVLTMGSPPGKWGTTLPPPSLSDPGSRLCTR